MNGRVSAELIAQQAADERMRIHTAAVIASGMLAHSQAYAHPSWKSDIPFEAVNMADKIIARVRSA